MILWKGRNFGAIFENFGYSFVLYRRWVIQGIINNFFSYWGEGINQLEREFSEWEGKIEGVLRIAALACVPCGAARHSWPGVFLCRLGRIRAIVLTINFTVAFSQQDNEYRNFIESRVPLAVIFTQ